MSRKLKFVFNSMLLFLAVTASAVEPTPRSSPNLAPVRARSHGLNPLFRDTKAVAPGAPAPKPGLKMIAGCTDTYGTSLKAGDPGYGSCITDAQKQGSPETNAPKASMGVSIGQ